MEENITPQPLAGDGNIAPSAGTGAGSEEVVSVKDLFKQVLNKDFPTDEAAIKSLTDTYSYVGSMGQQVKTLETQLAEAQKQTVTPEIQKQISDLQSQLAEGNFYQNNPQYNTPEAKGLIQKFGGKPEDVVKDEIFVKAFGALQKTAEIDKSQSIIHTNPRIGIAQDNLTKAAEAQKAGNSEGAAAAATQAVMDAYSLK